MEQLTELVKRSHAYAVKNGFYDEELNVAEKLMLIVSELGEALEAYREDKDIGAAVPISLITELTNKSKDGYDLFKEFYKDTFQDEIADTFIRLFDLCGALDIDIQYAVWAKMAYNEMRPYKHGKQF